MISGLQAMLGTPPMEGEVQVWADRATPYAPLRELSEDDFYAAGDYGNVIEGPTLDLPYNWSPRPYQQPLWDYLMRGGTRASAVWHRRAGKDELALHWACCATQLRTGNYWHMLPQANQARKAIWNAVNPHTGRRRIDEAFPAEIRASTRDDEMIIKFRNGSTWQVLGSDNFDALVGSPPLGLVFSEWALADPLAWGMLRPILLENGGWALFIGCVSPDTMVLSREGLLDIGEALRDAPVGYSPHRTFYYGLDNAFHQAEEGYRLPRTETIKIRTAKGYEIECTPIHPLWTGTEWRRSRDWRVGGLMPIQLDQQVFGSSLPAELPNPNTHGAARAVPFDIDADLFYFIGLMVAEGSWERTRVHVSNKDWPIKEFLAGYGFKTNHKRDTDNTCSSMNLVHLVEWFGVRKGARKKDVPRRIRQAPRWAQIEFLRGYFDGDGCATKKGTVHCDTVSPRLAKQLQVMLLNFGIVSRRTVHDKRPTKKVRVWSRVWRVEIEGHWAARFFERIGFRLERKQERYHNLTDREKTQRENYYQIPAGTISDDYWAGLNEGDTRRQAERGVLSHHTIERLHARRPHPFFEKTLDDGFYYDKIVSIEASESEVYDFVIPDTRSFFSNGPISHNTPRGHNHGEKTHKLAAKSPDWFGELLTVEDTAVFTPEQLRMEREELIAEHGEELGQAIYEQEYFCSFNAATPGAYFTLEMRKMRNEGRILDDLVPLPGLPVHTYWDIGVRDRTAIIFVQKDGPRELVVDYHEESNRGVDHYAKVLEDKRKEYGWTYGAHVGPHDLEERVWGTVGARKVIHLAQDIGIKFKVAPKLKKIDSVNHIRSYLARMWVSSKRCGRLISALEQHHAVYDESRDLQSAEPEHDWTSHPCLIPTTQVLMSSGVEKAIEDVCIGERVSLPGGLSGAVIAAGQTGVEDTIRVCFNDGSEVECTREHPFMTMSGLVSASDLAYNQPVFSTGVDLCQSEKTDCEKSGTRASLDWNLRASSFGYGRRGVLIARSEGAAQGFFTEFFGKLVAVRKSNGIKKWFPSTGIGMIFVPETGSFKEKGLRERSRKNILFRFLPDGSTTERRMTGISIRSRLERICTGKSGSIIKGKSQAGTMSTILTGTKATTVSRIWKSLPVRIMRNSALRQIRGWAVRLIWRIWPKSVPLPPLRVVAKLPGTKNSPVYDLKIEHHHCFFANGVLVSNCDALKYGAQSPAWFFTQEWSELQNDSWGEPIKYPEAGVV